MNIFKIKINITLVLIVFVISGCESYAPQRYSAMPDNTPIIRALSADSIKVNPFILLTTFDAACRAVGDITPPINMTMQSYIQTALADELKVAGLYDESAPKFVLSGSIDLLNFSSSKGLTNGEWNIGLTITSSNGKSMYAAVSYQFESAFGGDTACRRTAEAFLPAVQNLIAKIVRSEDFRSLIGI